MDPFSSTFALTTIVSGATAWRHVSKISDPNILPILFLFVCPKSQHLL